MEAYTYDQLDEDSQDIRVLTLLPGAPNDPVRIKVHRVHLPEKSWDAPHLRSTFLRLGREER